MQPGNPIVGGVVLRRPAIVSPDYVAGSQGWAIFADGTAEFNNVTIRGVLDVIGADLSEILIQTAGGSTMIYLWPPGGRSANTQGKIVTAANGITGSPVLELFSPVGPSGGTGVSFIDLWGSVNAGDGLNFVNIGADDLQFNNRSLPRGSMLAPISTTTDTGTLGATEGQDTNLGTYAFTARTGRLYQPYLANAFGTSGTVGDRYIVRLRDGGNGAPTNTSPIVSETMFVAQAANQPQPLPLLPPFSLSSGGTHTLGLYVLRSAGANTMTITSSGHYASGTQGRYLYVADNGPST